MKWLRNPIVTGVAGLLVGLVIGVSGASTPTDEAGPNGVTAPVEDSPTPSPSPVPEPAGLQLTKDNLKLDLQILSKENFGSAGSNIEYRVVPTLLASTNELDAEGVWEVTYEVLGAEDGPIIGTFKVWGTGDYEVPEGLASTPSVSTKLRVKVTAVGDAPG
jgi:hypothetical protein